MQIQRFSNICSRSVAQMGNVNNRPDKLGTFIRLPVALQNHKNDKN